MPPLKFFSCSNIVIRTLCCIPLFSINLQAAEFELTTFIGHTFSPDLATADNLYSIATTDETNVALALSWQDTPTGQGQILVNYVSRDFTDDIYQATHSFDTLYAHFNGVAFFKERDYITTVGLGFGGTYFKSDTDDVLYPSLTVALGTRYEFSDRLAFITELRAYATLTETDEPLFCQSDACFARFDNAVWFDGQVSIGLAYSF